MEGRKDHTTQYNKKVQKMLTFDCETKEGKKEYNPKRPESFDYPYRKLRIGGSGSGKRNALLNLINNEPDII